MNGDGIVPPQGLNVINEKKTLYGLPLSVPSGGGGTRITAKTPTGLKFGSGQSIKIIDGTYTPAVKPPVSTDPHTSFTGSGMCVKIIDVKKSTVKSGGGGTRINIITPVFIRNGAVSDEYGRYDVDPRTAAAGLDRRFFHIDDLNAHPRTCK